MKQRNTLTLVIGSLLLLIFVVLLFTFQVRQTEVAVVTTFDKPSALYDGSIKPGLKFKLPSPIQKVFTFDKRIQNFEDTLESALTRDAFNLLISVYAGWTISDPAVFFSAFPNGTVEEAKPVLEALVRNHKAGVVGRHPFSHFVSTDTNQLKFAEIEQQMIEAIRPGAEKNYGIKVEFLGIKKLGLPESVTQKVFERMQAERQREIDTLLAQGKAQADRIRSEADRARNEILAAADGLATGIRGEADAAASASLQVFNKAPDLAIFLEGIKTMVDSLKERSTLILDERTAPFNLLTRPANAQPEHKSNLR
ncbi:MAG: protease modulator HflC [Verrucomicrobiales bacterium]|nr:protease modulator HflC [Verrucomicrobiales bacterium]